MVEFISQTTKNNEEANGKVEITVSYTLDHVENKTRSEKWEKVMTILNYMNILVGAGVMSLPATMNQGGVGASVAFIILTATICSFTACLLVRCAALLKLDSYQDIATHVCGTPGRVVIIICQFFYPTLVTIMFSIIVTDNVIEITAFYFPESIVATSRPIILFIFFALFFAPLSFLHNISYIDKFSALSIILVFEILFFILIRLVTMASNTFLHETAYTFGRSGFVQSMATMCFAFTSHHNTLQVYNRSKDKDLKNFYSVIIYSHIMVAALVLLTTLFCYSTFTVLMRGNLFNYYCGGDSFADASRLLFTITIGLTYPFQVFASRQVIKDLFKEAFKSHCWLHYLTTFLLLLLSYIIATFFRDAAFIMEIGGGFTSSPMAYILPVIFYIKLFHKTWKPCSIELVVLWAILIYGSFIAVFSTAYSIYDMFQGRNINLYRTWCSNYFN